MLVSTFICVCHIRTGSECTIWSVVQEEVSFRFSKYEELLVKMGLTDSNPIHSVGNKECCMAPYITKQCNPVLVPNQAKICVNWGHQYWGHSTRMCDVQTWLVSFKLKISTLLWPDTELWWNVDCLLVGREEPWVKTHPLLLSQCDEILLWLSLMFFIFLFFYLQNK